MQIRDMPFFSRPDFKLIKKGAINLDDAELLSILFWNGSKGESALDLSNRLLKDYNFHKLSELSFTELKAACNGDYLKPLKILSLIELSKRYNQLIRNGHTKTIKAAEDVFNILSDRFVNEKKEHFVVFYLNTRNKIIREETVFIGTLNASLIHPREIFKGAIRESANAILIAHNHPSGDPNPSKEDIEITERLIEAGELLNIEMLDHVIIGHDKYYSFKD